MQVSRERSPRGCPSDGRRFQGLSVEGHRERFRLEPEPAFELDPHLGALGTGKAELHFLELQARDRRVADLRDPITGLDAGSRGGTVGGEAQRPAGTVTTLARPTWARQGTPLDRPPSP